MNYAEASRTVQDYTGNPLLESLEEIRSYQDRDDGEFDLLPGKVQSAYYSLMAGFAKMFK